MFLWLKTLYRKRAVTWPFIFYTIIWTLSESVYEELKNGVHNFNYGVFYEPIWKGKLEINVSYCDSKHNYLIQASDILANRLWTSFKIDNREMRNIPEHSCMRLP